MCYVQPLEKDFYFGTFDYVFTHFRNFFFLNNK